MEVSQHWDGAAIAPLGGTVHLGLWCFTCRLLSLRLLQEDLPRFPPCLAQRMCWIHILWKTEKKKGSGGEGWVRTRGALNYPEMLTPGGDGAGIGENSPPRKRWAPVQWHLSEAGELLAQPPHKASIRLSVLLSWLSLLCRIKKQHVLPVSVGFP